METIVNNLVKLKVNAVNYAEMKEDVFLVKSIGVDGRIILESIKSGNCITEYGADKIKYIKLYNIHKFWSKLAVGDIVVTNGNGSRIDSDFIVGKIGEIIEDELYLWNNSKKGGVGSRSIIKYKYSWVIRKSSQGEVSIIKRKAKLSSGIICSHCEEKTLEHQLKPGLDGKLYCKECYTEVYVKCEECDNIVDTRISMKISDGKFLCQYCFEKNSELCCKCVIRILVDDMLHNNDGDNYCEDCYNEKYCHCSVCEEEILNADAFTHSDETYCGDCFNERFTTCENCENTISNDEAFYDEESDHYFCHSCHCNRVGKNIHEYSYHPTEEFKKMKWEDDLFLGLELEVRHEDAAKKSEKFIKFLEVEKVKKLFYLKHDTTVDEGEGKGFEIVSHPATLHYWHKQIKMQKIITWLKKEEFDAEESGKCGIHIHISRAFFTDLEVAKLRLFFKKNMEQLKKFSRREVGETDSSDPYHFCSFEDLADKEILNNIGQNSRYWALNLNSSRETVEIRLFRATLDYQRFLAILQFSEAISRFVKRIGIAAFIYGEREYKNNSWKLFTDWAKEENKYKDMINYFDKNKITKGKLVRK